jgi:hypothetical protein
MTLEALEKFAAASSIAMASDARPHLLSAGRDFAGRVLITAHTAQATSTRRNRIELLEKLRNSGIPARFRVRTHKARSLAKARSLEHLLRKYGQGEVVHDPLGVFGRSAGLVTFAGLLREKIGAGVKGIFWHARWRTVYVVLDPTDFFSDEKVKPTDLAWAETTTFACLREACGEDASEFVKAIRLGFEMPALPVVAIDRASSDRGTGWLSDIRSAAAVPTLAAIMGVGSVSGAAAADLPGSSGLADIPPAYSEPAVSGPNGKFSIQGGVVDSDNTNTDGVGLAAGSYSIPLGHAYGLQVDGAAGVVDNDFVGGVAGHLFWRDPSVGLFGMTAAFVAADGSNGAPNREATRLGGEGEYYLEQFSIEAAAGYQFSKNADDGFYGSIDLAWYATDNLRFSIGGATNPVLDHSVRGGFEYQPGISGWSGLALFADGTVGDDGFASVLGGIRFYFGDDKSLKDRHRKDDPGNAVLDTINDGGVSNQSSGYDNTPPPT